MLSSAGQPEDSKITRELGIARCLTKPVKQSVLLNAITEVLGTAALSIEDDAPEVSKDIIPRRVLLVEDGLLNQKVAVDLLEQRGHGVVIANNGKEALAALEGETFDMVFMDVQMPEMDGFEATAAIRKKEQTTGEHIPIVAMTANAMQGDREKCLEAGMDGYISKPIRAAKLYKAVERVEPSVEEESEDITIGIADLGEEEPTEVVVETDACFDWAYALERLGGNEKALSDLAQFFVDGCPNMIADIHKAISDGDAIALRRTAHTLKGSADVFTAKRAVEAAFRLETIGREGNLTNVEAALSEVEKEIEHLLQALKAQCNIST